MRRANILVKGIKAGELEELADKKYRFSYLSNYEGEPVSLTMPVTEIKKVYEFDQFPSFFEGLLPEGVMLEALLRKYKLDKDDCFGQLLLVGQDVVGAVTIEEIK